MLIWAKIKEAWPLVTRARFNRMKADKDALLKEHKNMSDYVLQLNEQVDESARILSQAMKSLKGITF